MTFPARWITVVVPTSPIPAHPYTHVLDETLTSVADAGLGGCETLLLCDGVHPDLRHRAAAYGRYVAAVTAGAHPGRVTLVFGEHTHQAAMTARALATVRTPLVLFVEHDTPLEGEIPWRAAAAVIESGEADVVRFHHEAAIPAEHEHLMPDPAPLTVAGLPMRRTVQWSQRPHLAGTEFYRRILADHFRDGDRTMIEDVMHGVVQDAWHADRDAGWARYRLWIYHPPGSIRRSRHLDGRGGDPTPAMTLQLRP